MSINFHKDGIYLVWKNEGEIPTWLYRRCGNGVFSIHCYGGYSNAVRIGWNP